MPSLGPESPTWCAFFSPTFIVFCLLYECPCCELYLAGGMERSALTLSCPEVHVQHKHFPSVCTKKNGLYKKKWIDLKWEPLLENRHSPGFHTNDCPAAGMVLSHSTRHRDLDTPGKLTFLPLILLSLCISENWNSVQNSDLSSQFCPNFSSGKMIDFVNQTTQRCSFTLIGLLENSVYNWRWESWEKYFEDHKQTKKQ